MKTPNETIERLKRLTFAAAMIFALCFVVGLLSGYILEFAVGGFFLAIVLARPWSQRLHFMEFPGGAILPFVVSLILTFALLLAAIFLRADITEPPGSIAIGLLPVPALIAAVFFLGQAISRLDDLQRRIQTEGLAIGFGLFLILLSTYALLNFFGLPAIDWIIAPPVMLLCYAAGKIATTLRYR